MQTQVSQLSAGTKLVMLKDHRYAKAGAEIVVGSHVSDVVAASMVNSGYAKIATVRNKRRKAPENKSAV